jgi:6-phosphogluconolactonase
MLALSIGKKRKLMMFLRMLVMTVWVVGMVTILASCGTSPGYSYTISGSVSGMIGSGLVLQNNGGDDLSFSDNGAFSFNTAITNGSAYSITVKAQPGNPSQSCVVSNGSGSINGSPVSNVEVNCTMSSSPVIVDPSGQFAYVSNYSSTSISSYRINPDGSVSHTAPPTTPAGNNPNPVTIDPLGQFAYVSNISDGTVFAFTIDQTSGNLINEKTVITEKYPTSVTIYADPVSKVGKFAYVANMGSGTISAYKIEQTTTATITAGELTPIGTVPAGNGPTSVTIGANGPSAYVPNMSSGTISVYTINSDGSLNVGTPVNAGTSPVSVTIYADPDTKVGKFAYAANMGTSIVAGTISVYTINSDGSLNVGAAVATEMNPMSVTVDPLGTFAYVSNVGSGTISVYTIDSTTGALTALGTAVGTGTYPNPVTIYGGFAYVSNVNDGIIWVYTINSDGSLSLLDKTTAGTSLTTVTIDSKGPFAYVSNISDGSVFAYTIGADGKLTTVP